MRYFRDILNHNRFMITIISVLFILLFVTLSAKPVLAQVSIDNVDIPDTIQENSVLSISVDASTDLNSSITYFIYKNGLLVSNANNYSESLGYNSSGTYTYMIKVQDANSSASENDTVTVVNVPLQISLSSPANTTFTSRYIDINLSVSTYADSCTYNINGTSGSLSNISNQFFGNINLSSDGQYYALITCSNRYDSSQSSASFRVDTTNPVVLSKSYSIDANNVVTLNMETNVQSTCRYDTSDIDYSLMSNTFNNTNALQHSTSISGLTSGNYNYYIRCKGLNNATMQFSEAISFTFTIIPTAAVYLDTNPPLKSGTYSVKLVTSEPVQNNPTLYYTLDNDQSPRYVSLTGSGTLWTGYLIVDDNIANRVATLHFSGKDFGNNVGSVITVGQLFLIDSVPPIAPSSIDAIAQSDGSIQVKWYYDGEPVRRFNIYRSTSGSTDYVDYYDSSNTNYFVDTNVISGVTYYYRIAAVDDANNDGALSSSVDATSQGRPAVSSDGTTAAPSQTLDSQLFPKVDQQVTQFKNYITDIESNRVAIGKINDPVQLNIISILGLNDKFKAAEDTINGLIDQTNSLKNQDLKPSELDVNLNKLRLEAVKAESTVVEDIIVQEQSSYEQITQESDVDGAVSAVTEPYNLSKSIISNYSTSNKLLQDYVTVDTDIMIFKIKYMGMDDYNKYTLVKKTVKSSKQLNNVILVETVPKDFDNKASDIIFNIGDQQNPTVVSEDPVLRWDLDTLNSKTIYYMINNIVDMSSAKGAKTVVLSKPDFKFNTIVNSNNNGLTGFVSLETITIGKLSPMQWIVIVGLGLMIGLFVYSSSLDRREKKKGAQRLREHKILLKTADKQVQSRPQIIQTLDASIGSSKRLDEANRLINSFNYEKSRQVYNECMKSPISRSDQAMLDHVFIKLQAYRSVYLARKNLSSKNYEKTRQEISNINAACIRMVNSMKEIDEDYKDDERKFIDYIMNSKKHLESMSS